MPLVLQPGVPPAAVSRTISCHGPLDHHGADVPAIEIADGSDAVIRRAGGFALDRGTADEAIQGRLRDGAVGIVDLGRVDAVDANLDPAGAVKSVAIDDAGNRAVEPLRLGYRGKGRCHEENGAGQRGLNDAANRSTMRCLSMTLPEKIDVSASYGRCCWTLLTICHRLRSSAG